MRVAPNVRRWVAAAALAALLVLLVALSVGCGGGPSPQVTTIVDEPAPGDTNDRGGDADEVTNDPVFEAAGRSAERRLAAADVQDAWAVPDAVAEPMDRLWNNRVGAYVSPGGRVSTRLNSEMLRIHASAALAGHHGPSRQDARVRRIAAYLTGPAYIDSAQGERFGGSRHNSIHVPGWRQSSAPVVNQHPSIDAAVARGLRAAWTARAQVGLSGDEQDAIRSEVVAVASSPAFRAPARLLNQINWNADLYAAAATVAGDQDLLKDDYRQQLEWFAQHAHTPATPAGLPNLSAGDGFFYQPGAKPGATLNRSDTVEYASIVLGSLRYYDEALRAGMQPLDATDGATLREWAVHTLDADWTTSGYLNWETGKAGSRLHLRQYWALALDGAANAARSGSGLTGIDPGDGDRLISRGEELFRRWAAGAGSVLLPATSFDYPSRFVGVRNNHTTASVRLAGTLAEWASTCGCGGRLASTGAAQAQLHVSLDPQLHRLAVNGPRYSTAISPTAIPTGGGLEPAWILDADGSSLGALGGGGSGSLGLHVSRAGRTLADTQPGPSLAAGLTLQPEPGDPGAFTGRAVGAGVVVRVTHRFTADRIVTSYVVDPDRPVDVGLRIPSTGRAGTVRCTPDVLGEPARTVLPGCARGDDYLVRTGGGARMHVGLRGLPRAARVAMARTPRRSTVPRPGEQATIRFRVDRRTTITRTLRPDADPD